MSRKELSIFLPLLVLYTIIILLNSAGEFVLDEDRYVGYAQNLLEGHYSPYNNISLINGPGYPLFLTPFIYFNIPWIVPKLLNGLLLFGAIVLFYNSLQLYIEKKPAALFSMILGLYPPILIRLPYLLTESITFFFICGFIYSFCSLCQKKDYSFKQLVIAVFFLSALVLTRVFFGYVVLFLLIFMVVLCLVSQSKNIRKSLIVFVFTLLFCSPYLIYTHSLTGKYFYWSTNGGEVLYWMTTPYENELGEWFSKKKVYENQYLSKNHKRFYEEIDSLGDFDKDKKYKTEAIKNIKAYPEKYIKNWVANIGRLLFNYPYSYTPQKISSYFRLIPNMFIVVVTIFSLYHFYIFSQLVPWEIKLLLILFFIYLGGSSLVSATSRYFTISVPFVYLWIVFFINRFVKFDVKNNSKFYIE